MMLKLHGLSKLAISQGNRFKGLTTNNNVLLNRHVMFQYQQQMNFGYDSNNKTDGYRRPYGNSAQQQQEQDEQLTLDDQAYINKFGKKKSDLLDSWLEMSNDSLIKECLLVNLPTTGKHIENMQSLFDYLKLFDQQIISGNLNKKQNFATNDKEAERPPQTSQYNKNYDESQSNNQYSSQNRNSNLRRQTETNKYNNNNNNSNYSNSSVNQRQGYNSNSSGNSWNNEIDKAQVSLKEDINRIFGKNKGKGSQQDYTQQQISPEQHANTPIEILEPIKKDPPFLFTISKIKAAIKTRGDLNERPKQTFTIEQKPNVSASIFAMNQTQLEERFRQLIGNKEGILSKMSLSFEDYDKLEVSKKKRLLVNMENIAFSSSHAPDQNSISALNLPNLTQDLELEKMKDINFMQQLVQIATDESSQNKSQIEELLLKSYLKHGEKIFYDASILDISEHARVLKFATQEIDSAAVEIYQSLKIHFSNGVRKILSKRNISKVNFEDKLNILNMLPSMANSTLAQSQKSLNYLILNDILTNDKLIWETLQKSKVFQIVEQGAELDKCRDIQNKIRAQLTQISTVSFSIDDYKRLFKILSENKDGHIDVRLVTQLMIKRSLKSFAFLPNSAEFSKFVDFFQYLYKTNPIVLSFIPFEIKFILFRANELASREYLKLNDMIKMANIVVPSLYKPAFFFEEMIKTPKGSFKNDAETKELLELVEQITLRIGQGDMVFEHLEMSTSRLHKNYKPYTEETFVLLQKILSDLIQPDEQTSVHLSQDELRVANKIFQCEPLMLKLFRSSKQALELIEPVIDSQLAQINEQLSSSTASSKTTAEQKSTLKLDHMKIDIQQWEDMLKAIRNIYPVVQTTVGLVQKINSLVENAHKLLNHEINNFQDLSLDDYLKLNKAVLKSLERFPALVKQYQEESPFYDIVKQTLDYQFYNKKPYISKFEKTKKNLYLSKIIQAETNHSVINKHIGSFINYMRLTNGEYFKQLAINLVKDIKNVRSLMNEDLINLFQVVDKYSINIQTQQTLINVASNLMTVDQRRILTKQSNDDKYDINFQNEQEKREKLDAQNKTMIYNKYHGIFMNDPLAFSKPEVVLGPLSSLLADVFDQFTDQQILEQLQLLGSEKLDNYHRRYIKKLYERYSQPYVIENMWKNNSRFFFNFAKHWPHFLKNNAILNVLIQIKSSSSIVTEQAETLSILTKKNVLHPELIEAHFDTFSKMKDKNLVQKYLKDFMHSCSYLGYAGVDMEKLTQMFRRIYKTPDQVEISDLLNYLIILSLSDYHYLDFDEKSIKFVHDAIEIIEFKYTGVEVMEVKKRNQQTGEEETFSLDYYRPIPTDNKVYNKVVIKAKEPKLDFTKAYKALDDDESSSEDVEEVSPIQKRLQLDHLQSDQDSPLMAGDVDKQSSQNESDISGSSSSSSEGEGEDDEKKGKGVLTEDNVTGLADNTITSVGAAIESIISERHHSRSTPHQVQTFGEKAELPIYERKASEGLYSEELEFHQYRKKKLVNMDKKSKHLLLFSNINQLNFVDINQSDTVKAWAVLFHFKSKSLDSVLYDEFESVTMRNTIGKSKGHELYNKFYMKLIQKSYDARLRINLTQKCSKTGWPVDITISTTDVKNSKKLALYFFLQEEVCFNAKTSKDEPLALQKLMLKHLSSISDYKVDFVTENNFYMNQKDKEDLKSFVDEFIWTNFGGNEEQEDFGFK